jgi:PKD repeat protein
MREEARKHTWRIAPAAGLALGAALLLGAGTAQAGIRYIGDGAVQNSRGGWDLPKQGACPADPTAKTRPDCIARWYTAANSAACTALGTAGQYSWSTGSCADLVNTTQAACEKAVDRHWNANGSCSIVMDSDDRNDLVCARHGGTWVTTGTCTAAWVMPSRTDPAYGAGGLLVNDSASGAAGAGDQCLRCHNTVTQYNGPRVRDTNFTLAQGHKNMSRPVDTKTFKPWGGPDFSCTGKATAANEHECVAAGGTWDPAIYPSDDSGNTFNWTKNTITTAAGTFDLKWIYGDWLAALPRAIYTGATLNNMSYSCGRCHTTGWTSDAGTVPNAKKHPETDFPGITWNGTGTTGQVKTGGGVAGDKNVMSSWDQWGITCSRCHQSAVDDTTSAPSFAAPPGMSGHHNNLTSPTNNSGACTDVRWTSAPSGSTLEAACATTGGSFVTACSVNPTAAVCTMAAATKDKCTAVSGTWVAAKAGWCSNAFYTDSASCTANKYTWADGWCKTADAQSACTGGTGDAAKAWRLNGTQASCQVAGATWSFARCSVEGFCNKGTCTDSKYTNQIECTAAGAFWYAIRSKGVCDAVGGQFAYATDVIRCENAGGRWNSNFPNRGQIITSVCMDCHRQETSGFPNTNGACSDTKFATQGACVAGGATWTESGNGLPLTVGPYHSTVTFPSHPHSNQFLNSPHAKFSGKWNEIATGTFDVAGASKYKSTFMTTAEASNTGNGCTGCHEVHTSIVAGEKPFRSDCAECHHVKSLERLLHPAGAGTPLEKVEEEPMEACVTCHMPSGVHLFRINTDKDYSTYPMPQAMAANTAANTAADGAYTNAVWVDLDAACGQCHGGGAANVKTTGTVAAGSASLTVASATGLAVGQKIRVAGAGAYYYDDIGQSGKNTDFDTYVKAIEGNKVTLAGTATKAVTNAVVTQNVTTKGASYQTKEALSVLAKGMHNDVPSARFTATQGVNELTVAVDASTSRCSGKLANCEAFDWNWGDNTSHGSAVSATHAYAAPGAYTVTLTVRERSSGAGTSSQTFTAKAIPGAPTVTGSCVENYPTWSANCTVTVPTSGYASVTVSFGDGAEPAKASNPTAGSIALSHTYQQPGNYTIRATVVNAAGLSATATIGSMGQGNFVSAMPSISGKVLQKDGVLPVGSAQISVLLGNSLVLTTMSGPDGSYSTGRLKPATYTIKVNQWGYNFANPYGPFTIGPSLTNQNLVAGP